MDPKQAWTQVDGVLQYVRSWIIWGLKLVFPVVLLLLVMKGTKAALVVGDYVPMPQDYMVWLYLAGIWYLMPK